MTVAGGDSTPRLEGPPVVTGKDVAKTTWDLTRLGGYLYGGVKLAEFVSQRVVPPEVLQLAKTELMYLTGTGKDTAEWLVAFGVGAVVVTGTLAAGWAAETYGEKLRDWIVGKKGEKVESKPAGPKAGSLEKAGGQIMMGEVSIGLKPEKAASETERSLMLYLVRRGADIEKVGTALSLGEIAAQTVDEFVRGDSTGVGRLNSEYFLAGGKKDPVGKGLDGVEKVYVGAVVYRLTAMEGGVMDEPQRWAAGVLADNLAKINMDSNRKRYLDALARAVVRTAAGEGAESPVELRFAGSESEGGKALCKKAVGSMRGLLEAKQNESEQ